MSNLSDVIRARLTALDPTLDVSAGSPAESIVINPLVDALSGNALSTDSAEFIRAKLREAFPEITFGTGDALTDILVNASSVLLEPFRREIARISNAQSLRDIDQLAEDDVDALASNWMVSRIAGAFARVSVIVTLSNPRLLRINSSVRFITRAGLVFTPSASYTLNASEVASYATPEGLFEVPVQCVATQRGSEYNIDVGEVIAVENLDPATRATNRAQGVGGVDRESSQALVSRITQVINERSLVTERGIRAKLLAEEHAVDKVTVIGHGDDEMTRDQLSADVSGDTSSVGFAVPFFNSAVLCLYRGEPTPGDTLHLSQLGGSTDYSVEVKDVQLVGDMLTNAVAYYVDIDYIPEGPLNVWSCHVESPPQVYLGSDTLAEEVSIGGKVDVYVTPNDDRAESRVIDRAYSGGITGIGVGVSSVAEGHKSVLSLYSDLETRTIDLAPFNRRDYSYVVVESGSLAGAYQIVSTVLEVGEGKVGIIVDHAFNSETFDGTARWRAVNRLEIPINRAFSVIEPFGTNALTVRTLPDRRSLSANYDVGRYVLQGDILHIPDLTSDLVISAVEGNIIRVDSDLQSSGQFSAEIRRSSTAFNQITSYTRSVEVGATALEYSECLGAEVKTASDPITLNEGGVGRVCGNLHSLFSRDNRVLSISMSAQGYEVPISQSQDISYRGWTNPDDAETSGVFIVRVVWDLENNSGDDADAFEFALPTDLLLRGRRSVAVCYGDLDVDALIAEVEALYASGGSIQDLSSSVLSTSRNVINGVTDDLITVGGASSLINAVYPIYINASLYVDDQSVRSVDRSRYINLSLVTTKTQLPSPRHAFSEPSMVFSSESSGALPAIDLLDFIKMLCRPELLSPQGALTSSTLGALSAAGLPVSVTPDDVPRPNVVDEIITCMRPSRGTMSLYYSGPKTLTLRKPHLFAVSHGMALSNLIAPRSFSYSSEATHAEGLYLSSSVAQSVVYSRDAEVGLDLDLTHDRVFFDVSAPTPEEDHAYGADYLTVQYAAFSVARPQAETRVDILSESLSITSAPPRVEVYTLSIRELAGGTPVQQVIDNALYTDWVIDSEGSASSDVSALLNSYGNTPLQLLSSLDPLAEVVFDPNINSPSPLYVFYSVTHIDNGAGLPTFSAEPGSNALTLNKLYVNHSVSIPQSIRGDLIWIEGQEQGKVTSSSEATLVTNITNEPGTATPAKYGWCYINTQEPDKLVLEGPRVKYLDSDGAQVFTETIIGDNVCGLFVGGTSSFFSTSDTGKTLDLINASWDPRPALRDFGERGIPLPDGFPQPESAQIHSAHLGSNVITSIESSSEQDVVRGVAQTYRQVITLESPLDLSSLGYAELEGYLPVFFRMADDFISVDADVYKTCITAQVYHREPSTYKVRSIPMDYGASNQRIELHTLGDEVPSKVGAGVFSNESYGDYTIATRDTRRTPYRIYSPEEVTVTTEAYYGAVHKVDVDYVSMISSKPSELYIREVENASASAGFSMRPGELTYTPQEDYSVSLIPVAEINGSRTDLTRGELAVTAEVSPTVSTLTSKYNSPRHRAVCSDLLIRRAYPCYVGVFLRYVGGSSVDVVKSDLHNLVRASLRRGLDISGTDIVSLAHKRGARHVPESAIYLVMSDALRKRRIFFLRGPLSEALNGTYSGSFRTVGVQLNESEKLGVTLDVERL